MPVVMGVDARGGEAIFLKLHRSYLKVVLWLRKDLLIKSTSFKLHLELELVTAEIFV